MTEQQFTTDELRAWLAGMTETETPDDGLLDKLGTFPQYYEARHEPIVKAMLRELIEHRRAQDTRFALANLDAKSFSEREDHERRERRKRFARALQGGTA